MQPLYGLMAIFETPEHLVQAALQARSAGYKNIQAYTPFHVEGLSDAIGFKENKIAFLTLLGGMLGSGGGYAMQYYANVWAYPLNIGGRPLHSWPAFVPVAFELALLFAALFAIFGMLFLNRLPTFYHPVFNVPDFKKAALDGFFLCIRTKDPNFGEKKTRDFLESLSPKGVFEVEQ